MFRREKLIELLKLLRIIESSGYNFDIVRVFWNVDYSLIITEITTILNKLLNKEWIILDGEKIKQDVIASRTREDCSVFIENQELKKVGRYKYSIGWNVTKAVNGEDEELLKYSDDIASKQFIDYLIKEYTVQDSKEE